MAEKRLKLTLIKSMNGRLEKHRCCAKGLGLRRINCVSYVIDTPQNRGMINKIDYMLKVEEGA